MTDTSIPEQKPAAAPPPTSLLQRAQASTAKNRPGVEGWLFGIRDEVAELLTGSPFDVDSYLQAAFREVAKSADLRKAASQAGDTLLGAVMLGATLQLPIGGPLGQFYITPRNEGQGENRRTVAVPMIGYRGFFELGYRSGRVSLFDYIIVRDGDRFEKGANSERGKWFDWDQLGEDENDEKGNRRELTGVVALARLSNGDVQHQTMSRAAIERRRPTNWAKSPWNGKDQEAMYVKTPHREMAKFMQLSISSARAVEADENIANWNRVTGAIDTIRDEQAGAMVYGEGADAQTGEIPADSGDAGPSEPERERAPVTPQETPNPADGRTASQSDGVAPGDLPALASAEGREMTDAEFERYSAWDSGRRE